MRLCPLRLLLLLAFPLLVVLRPPELKLRIHWGPTHPDGGDDFPMWGELFTSPPPDAHP